MHLPVADYFARDILLVGACIFCIKSKFCRNRFKGHLANRAIHKINGCASVCFRQLLLWDNEGMLLSCKSKLYTFLNAFFWQPGITLALSPQASYKSPVFKEMLDTFSQT